MRSLSALAAIFLLACVPAHAQTSGNAGQGSGTLFGPAGDAAWAEAHPDGEFGKYTDVVGGFEHAFGPRNAEPMRQDGFSGSYEAWTANDFVNLFNRYRGAYEKLYNIAYHAAYGDLNAQHALESLSSRPWTEWCDMILYVNNEVRRDGAVVRVEAKNHDSGASREGDPLFGSAGDAAPGASQELGAYSEFVLSFINAFGPNADEALRSVRFSGSYEKWNPNDFVHLLSLYPNTYTGLHTIAVRAARGDLPARRSLERLSNRPWTNWCDMILFANNEVRRGSEVVKAN